MFDNQSLMDKAYYIDNMTKIWRIKGLAVESLKTYIGCLNVYLDHFNRPPQTITREQRWDYFSAIQSPSTRSQAMTVVRQMHEYLLQSPITWQELPYVKKPDTIPQYFTLEETKRLINAISNPKQAFLAMGKLHVVHDTGKFSFLIKNISHPANAEVDRQIRDMFYNLLGLPVTSKQQSAA